MLRVKNLELLNHKTVSFELMPGQVLSIYGDNGVGKSLLLKSLARLIPKKSGEIILSDKNSLEFEVTLWRSKVMYLPPVVTFEEDQTVEDFLKVPFRFERYRSIHQIFFPGKYLDNLSKKMSLLSSGQKQQVALLRAISLNPQILLLDESFSHMDQTKRKMYSEILMSQSRKDLSLISVSHDPISFEGFKSQTLIL